MISLNENYPPAKVRFSEHFQRLAFFLCAQQDREKFPDYGDRHSIAAQSFRFSLRVAQWQRTSDNRERRGGVGRQDRPTIVNGFSLRLFAGCRAATPLARLKKRMRWQTHMRLRIYSRTT